jgi:hypothetical protein
VIHAAMVMSDRGLTSMPEEQFLAGLLAKVTVSVRIAQVFIREVTGFVLFFSSIQSFSRSAGQSNYAAGCVFKDAFAERLSQEKSCVVKTVNWGFWSAAGRVQSAEYRDLMARAGVDGIDPVEGFAALDEFMRSPSRQLVLYRGTRTDVLRSVSSADVYTAYAVETPSLLHALTAAG